MRKEGKVWAIGRSPASASPPATPISSCSRMPTLITRPGWRAAARPNWSALMSASTTARRGSWSSNSVAVAMKRSRIVSMAAFSLTRAGLGAAEHWVLGFHDGDDGVRPPLVRRGEGGLERVVVAAVHDQDRPSLALEPGRDATGPAVCRGGIVDDHGVQAVQADRAGERDGLVVGAFVEFGVADEGKHARPVESARPQAERRADGKTQTVAQRAAADLNARQQDPVGMVAQR